MNPDPIAVKLEWIGDNIQKIFLGANSMPELIIDMAALTKEERDKEHYGARFLCAAALSCFCNTFYNSLKQGGANVKSLTAKATINKDKDVILRTRFTEILLNVLVCLDPGDIDIFRNVKQELELGSLVTYSLPEGVNVEHDIQIV